MHRIKGFTLIELLIAMVIIGILSAIAVPKYHTYILHSKVMSAFASLNALKPSVEQHLAQGRSLTESNFLEALGAQQIDTQHVGTITLAQANEAQGIYQIKVTFNPQPLHDRVLLLTRTEGVWSCQSDLDDAYRPTHCTSQTMN